MFRKIVKIDREKCNGCGACVTACHEGAIGMVDGKAALVREDYCDGLGDCLPACPTDAITFEMREAPAYDELAVLRSKRGKQSQWPIQIKLVPTNASFFDGADLLVAADCTAFVHADFHKEFVKDRVTLVGCTKLDNVDYSAKLETIFRENDIKSITVVRMQVPCCGGMENAVKRALKSCGKIIPLQVVVISKDGQILN